jgi:uncharacterized membrane protein YgcG
VELLSIGGFMSVAERVGAQPAGNKFTRFLVFVLSASLLTIGLVATAATTASATDTYTFRVDKEFGFCWTRPATRKGHLQVKRGSRWKTVDRFKPSDYVRDSGCSKDYPYFLAFDYVGLPNKTQRMRMRIKGSTINGGTTWRFNVRWKDRRGGGGGGGGGGGTGNGGGSDPRTECIRYYNRLGLDALARGDTYGYLYYRHLASQC